MKILYIGNVQGINNIDKYYLTEKRLINGFIRLGHNVCSFNDRDHARYMSPIRSQYSGRKKMNKRLVEACDLFQPDMLILGHCKNVANSTLEEIRQSRPALKIAYINVDPLSVQQNVTDIYQRTTSADAIFITTAGSGLTQFNEDHARSYFFPNPVDPIIDIERAFDNQNADIDVLFLGRALNHQHDHRELLARYLSDALPSEINAHYGGLGINENTIYGDDYLKLLGRSKMGICTNKTQEYYLYASDRMSHYMASGIMAFIAEGPQFETILGDDSFVSFSSPEDLLEKITYYHNNPEERIAIAKTGYERVRDLFHNEAVCQFILDMTFNGESPNPPIWHQEDMRKRNL